MADYMVKDVGLDASGKDRVDWARHNMPILQTIKQRFSIEQPFKGHKIRIIPEGQFKRLIEVCERIPLSIEGRQFKHIS